MKSTISKKGLIGLSLAIVLLVIIFNPFQDSITTNTQTNTDTPLSQDELDEIDIFLASVVNTDEIFTESDNDAITNFLDEVGLDGTEKFGVLTNIAIISPDGEVTTQSDILGVSQLSVTDEDGNVRDLDTIQVTMQGISAKDESATSVWGTVEFYLDDDKIDTKKIWAGGLNNHINEVSFVNNLQFEFNPSVSDKFEIAEQQGNVDAIQADIDRRIANQSSSGRFVPDPLLPTLRDELAVEQRKLDILKTVEGTEIKRVIPPSFSDQEKKNFTFTLSDEGRDWVHESEHTFRVVLTDVGATLDSDNDHKTFSWTGQHIAYQLTVKVDGTKTVLLNDDNTLLQIQKADGKLQTCGVGYNHNEIGRWYHSASAISLKIDGELVVDNAPAPQPNLTRSNAQYCTTHYDSIPRDTDVVFIYGGFEFPVHTPKSQINYSVSVSMLQDRWDGNHVHAHSVSNIDGFAEKIPSKGGH